MMLFFSPKLHLEPVLCTMITHFLLEVLRIPCCFFPLTLHQDTLTVAAAALSPLPYPFHGWIFWNCCHSNYCRSNETFTCVKVSPHDYCRLGISVAIRFRLNSDENSLVIKWARKDDREQKKVYNILCGTRPCVCVYMNDYNYMNEGDFSRRSRDCCISFVVVGQKNVSDHCCCGTRNFCVWQNAWFPS